MGGETWEEKVGRAEFTHNQALIFGGITIGKLFDACMNSKLSSWL